MKPGPVSELVKIFSAFLPLVTVVLPYKPVIVIHGLLDDVDTFESLVHFITKAHPGTNVTVIDMYTGYSSLLFPLWDQVEGFAVPMQAIMLANPKGVHILCYSQGGLVCRGVLSILPKHNVYNFICLSAPLMGQYGDTSYFKYFFPFYTKKNLYRVVYTHWAQKINAVSNYWNDPHHQSMFAKYSSFLAVLNNNTARNNQSQEFRRNFLRVKNVVMIGGPDDGVITPWQSSHFSFYDSNETVVPMRKQKVYAEDTFGLRTLDKRKALHFCTFSGVRHVDWHSNFTVFTDCVLPWIT